MTTMKYWPYYIHRLGRIQNNMGVQRGSKIITNGLSVCTDATVEFRRNPSSNTLSNLVEARSDFGTFYNDPSLSSDGRGAFVDLDGTDDYIDFGDITWTDTTDLTFSFAARLTATTTDQVFFGKGTLSVTRPLNVFYDHYVGSSSESNSGSSKSISIVVRGSNNDSRIHLAGPSNCMVAGKDFTIDVVIDTVNKKVIVYKDGEPFLESAVNANFVGIKNTVDPIRVGATSGWGAPQREMAGRIYYFRIYERCLSADEVKQNYNSVKGRFA